MTAADASPSKYDAVSNAGASVQEELSEVYYIATRIRERLPQQIDLHDLVSAGVIGLLEAARNFDCTKNVHFKTFAKFRIHGAIMDSLREMDWGSRSLRKTQRQIVEATGRLQSRLARQPSEQEIARELGIDISQLQKARGQLDSQNVCQQVANSNECSESVDLIETAPDTVGSDPLELCLRAEQRELLRNAIARLSKREQTMLALYYREELTLTEISEVVGISASRLSQVRKSIISKLRAAMQEVEAASSTAPARRWTGRKMSPAAWEMVMH